MKKSLGLPGGPNQYVTDISEFISIEGYKRDSPDVNKPFNIIPSGNITMEGVDFAVKGRDNLGNELIMEPGGNYQFPGDSVLETRLAQKGIEVSSRNGVRNNKDGSESTHLMAAEELANGDWVGFPRLFQNPDNTWIDMSSGDWKNAYQEALQRGEVIEFGKDSVKAIAYGEGSWKPKMKRGGGLLDKTMKCNSCSWEWKAADGGSDIDTCHKCGSKALPKAQDGNGEANIYNEPIEQEDGIIASIDDFITPIVRSLTSREAGTTEDINLRIPPGKMKYFSNNQKPVNSNYIIGGDYMEDTPTAYKASEYPNTMYTTQGQTQEIDFETQQFYGIVDGNIKLSKKTDFKDDDVIVPLRPNFGGNFSIKKREPLDTQFIEKARKFNEFTNEIRESAYLFPEQKVWEEVYNENKGDARKKRGKYEVKPEYKDIIDEINKKFGKSAALHDLEPFIKDYNSTNYNVYNPAGNQLDTFGRKVILFDPESNEHLFISQLDGEKRNKKIIEFKKKYPNANYLNLDNGRFSSYMVNKDGITSDDATEYMQNSFKGTKATGYNFAYRKGGSLPKAQTDGQVKLSTTYKNYIFGDDNTDDAKKTYDKLNRIYYKQSKEAGMSPSNFIMTHVIGDS